MSYILDALKKAQAAQRGDMALSLAPRQFGGFPLWLSALLIAALIGNGGLLFWIFVVRADPVNQTPAPAMSLAQTPSIPSPVEIPPPQETQPAQPAVNPTPPVAQAKPPPVQAPPVETTKAIVIAPVTPAAESRPKPSPLQTRKLSQLPADEQTLFNDFKYTTHIYTDDPKLCAIVIDGRRLKAGDEFSGLIVQAITAEGVVFRQQTSDGARLVAVSVIEQWDN